MVAEPGVQKQFHRAREALLHLCSQWDHRLWEPDWKTEAGNGEATKTVAGWLWAVSALPGHGFRSLPGQLLYAQGSELQQDWLNQRRGRGTSPSPQRHREGRRVRTTGGGVSAD